VLEDSGDSDAASIHSEESLTYTIETTERPENFFANRIVIEESLHPATKNYVLFQNKMRHIIQFGDKDSLLHLLTSPSQYIANFLFSHLFDTL